jgi:hypothetical protein
MEKSTSIVEIAKALVAFHKEMPAVDKDSDNPFFKSKYAALEDIIGAADPVLVKNKLTFAQFPSGDHGLTTILMHESGEWLQDTYTMVPAKNDPQGTGSAITYQKRYALAAVLGLRLGGEDDDGNEASGHGPAKAGAQGGRQSALVPQGGAPAADIFAKAKAMVAGSKSIEGLTDYVEKLKSSKNFTPDQRTILTKLANDRIDALQNG